MACENDKLSHCHHTAYESLTEVSQAVVALEDDLSFSMLFLR